MLGKQKCRILKEIRQRIADENDIPYITKECSFQGDCSGTCPRCESELRYLESQLALRSSMKKSVTVAALCAGMVLASTGCSSHKASPNTPSTSATTSTTTKEDTRLSGDVSYDFPDENIDSTDNSTCTNQDESEQTTNQKEKQESTSGKEEDATDIEMHPLMGAAPYEK